MKFVGEKVRLTSPVSSLASLQAAWKRICCEAQLPTASIPKVAHTIHSALCMSPPKKPQRNKRTPKLTLTLLSSCCNREVSVVLDVYRGKKQERWRGIPSPSILQRGFAPETLSTTLQAGASRLLPPQETGLKTEVVLV